MALGLNVTVGGKLARLITIDRLADVRRNRLAFYRDNYARILDPQGEPVILRVDFVPGPDGRMAWLRFGGRLHARRD